MSVQAELLTEIESFLAERGGMAETTFGRLAVNDGKFVGRLRKGCNMTLATIDRTRRFMKEQIASRSLPAAAGVPQPAAPREAA
jgi:hypothetical protein